MRGTTRWALVLVTLVGGVLRFWDLGAHSVWLDEQVSIDGSETLIKAVSSFTHPPVGYVLLHGWRQVFGESDAALRGLAALVGTLCVPLLFTVAVRAFRSERIALTAALLFAVMPQAIWHAREIRHYTLWPAFTLLALWCVLAERDPPVRGRTRIGYWVWTTVAMATHYYTVFYAAAHALAAWCLIGTRPLVKTRADWRRWVGLHAPLLVAGLALLAYRWLSWGKLGIDAAGTQLGSPIRVAWWLASLVFFRPWAFPDPVWHAVRWGAFVAVVLVAVAVCMARDRTVDRRTVWALGIALWLPLVTIELLPVRSYARLLTPTLPLIVVWLAYAVWAPLASRLAQLARLAVAAVLVVKLAPYLVTAYTLEVEPWKVVCADIMAHEKPRTVVFVTEPYMKRPFRRCYAAAAPLLRFPSWEPDVSLDNLAAFAAPYDEIWFVYSHAWKSDPRRGAVRALLATHELVARRIHGPLLETFHLRRRTD